MTKQKFQIIPKEKIKETEKKEYESIEEECKLYLKNISFTKEYKMDLETYRFKMKQLCSSQNLFFPNFKSSSLLKEITLKKIKIRIDKPEAYNTQKNLPVHIWFCKKKKKKKS